MADEFLPVTGAWRPGDPPGRRQFIEVFGDEPLRLEVGGTLAPVTVAYETWGTLDAARANAVLVLHALTGDSHATGPIEPGHVEVGWWDGLIGPGQAIDTDRYFAVCPNVLGGCQGTTGPASIDPAQNRPYGSRFPIVTIRDQVAVEAALADALGIERWSAVVGGSMGGQRAVEWAVSYPERVHRAVVIACGAAATAEQIALCSLQIRAIESDPAFRGGRLLRRARRCGTMARYVARARHRSGELPVGAGARAAVRPGVPGRRRSPRRRPLRGRVLSRLSRREAFASVRCQHLRGVVARDEPPRRRPRSRRSGSRAGACNGTGDAGGHHV